MMTIITTTNIWVDAVCHLYLPIPSTRGTFAKHTANDGMGELTHAVKSLILLLCRTALSMWCVMVVLVAVSDAHKLTQCKRVEGWRAYTHTHTHTINRRQVSSGESKRDSSYTTA